MRFINVDLLGVGLLGVMVICAASLEAEQPAVERALVPDELVERSIRLQESHVYRLPELADDAHWRLIVKQTGIDVLVVERRAGRDVGSLNHHRDRFETESFRIDSSVEEVVIRPVVGDDQAGEYALRLQAPFVESSERLDLELRLTEASRVPHGSESEALERAALLYEEAASDLESPEIAEEFDEPERERAAALFSAANHRRVLGNAERATDLYGEAVEIWRRLEEPGWLAASLVGLGLSEWAFSGPDGARASLKEALELWPLAGERQAEIGHTHNSLGVIAHRDGDFLLALEHYRIAFEIHDSAKRERDSASLLANMSSVTAQLGDAESALKNRKRSLEIFRNLGDRRNELSSLISLGELQRRMADYESALKTLDTARDLAAVLGDVRVEGRALNSRGAVQMDLGRHDRAVTDLEYALKLRRRSGDRRGEFFTLDNLGECEYYRGDLETASRHWEAALALKLEGDQRLTALILGRLARLRSYLGEKGGKDSFVDAHELLSGRGDVFREAMLHYLQGDSLLVSGEKEKAVGSFSEALQRWKTGGDSEGEILASVGLARSYRALGDFLAAKGALASAIDQIESLRMEMINPRLRSAFLSSRHEIFELQVDTFVELYRQGLGEGYLQAALEMGDQARGRKLLDLMQDSRTGVVVTRVGTMVERQRELAARLSLLVRRQELVQLGRRRASDAADLKIAISDTLSKLDLIESEIRGNDSRRMVLETRPRLTVAAMQELLDPETVLLQYDLGAARSHLFVVSQNKLAHFLLPPQEQIEQAARTFHEALGTVGGATNEQNEPAEAIGRMILEPAVDLLRGKRLVILADGALHYVPFAALPWPGDEHESSRRSRLVDRFEMVRLPSLAVLAAERQASARRPFVDLQADSDSLTIAVLADPVFDPRDPRFLSRNSKEFLSADDVPVATLRGVEHAPAVFGRLPGSRLEAEAIASHLSPDRLSLALGFDASRDALLGARARPSVLHFATHGLIDSEHPELSGLVLSQFYPDGRRRADGFLRLHDIYDLNVDAELVVLSGCRTALGRELNGEAFQGLAAGFLHAGARRVMASLWPIADRATARLMDHFYRALFVEGIGPAAALRNAQLEMSKDRRFRDPYYWAGFVLQGDWTDWPGEGCLPQKPGCELRKIKVGVE